MGAHGEEELRNADTSAHSFDDKQRYNFKTAICRDWARDGTCQRGDVCAFAHGEEELRVPGQGMVDPTSFEEPQRYNYFKPSNHNPETGDDYDTEIVEEEDLEGLESFTAEELEFVKK